jgi:hypothetical protein
MADDEFANPLAAKGKSSREIDFDDDAVEGEQRPVERTASREMDFDEHHSSEAEVSVSPVQLVPNGAPTERLAPSSTSISPRLGSFVPEHLERDDALSTAMTMDMQVDSRIRRRWSYLHAPLQLRI